MDLLIRMLRAGPLLILSPFLLLISALSLALADCFQFLRGKKAHAADTRPTTRAASVVIPNWNGKDLLEKYLPSVVRALSACGENEIIVVDNDVASARDPCKPRQVHPRNMCTELRSD